MGGQGLLRPTAEREEAGDETQPTPSLCCFPPRTGTSVRFSQLEFLGPLGLTPPPLTQETGNDPEKPQSLGSVEAPTTGVEAPTTGVEALDEAHCGLLFVITDSLTSLRKLRHNERTTQQMWGVARRV
jgi:hypothetical protein